jgi:hypothetical protein
MEPIPILSDFSTQHIDRPLHDLRVNVRGTIERCADQHISRTDAGRLNGHAACDDKGLKSREVPYYALNVGPSTSGWDGIHGRTGNNYIGESNPAEMGFYTDIRKLRRGAFTGNPQYGSRCFQRDWLDTYPSDCECAFCHGFGNDVKGWSRCETRLCNGTALTRSGLARFCLAFLKTSRQKTSQQAQGEWLVEVSKDLVKASLPL